MLGCDMVGFHITDYCLNFVDCCQRNLGCRVDRKNLLVEHGGRTVRVRPLPIGIPFERFVELAEKAPKVFSTNQKIILGVDRLDYTKGLVHRLRAFEKLLENHPEHIEKVSGHSVSWFHTDFSLIHMEHTEIIGYKFSLEHYSVFLHVVLEVESLE